MGTMTTSIISILGIVALAILVGLFRGLGKHLYDKFFKQKVDREIEERRKDHGE